MTIDRFNMWLLPNPSLEGEPNTEVWRDIEVDGSHALANVHETIFDAFDRWNSHAYEFLTRDEDSIAIQSYVHPQMDSGDHR